MTDEDRRSAIEQVAATIDLRTTVIGVLRRSPLLVALVIASVAGGRVLGKHMSREVYQASTIIRYLPPPETSLENDAKTVVLTVRDTVKVKANIDAVRQRLHLTEPPEAIGQALDVSVSKNTTLIVMQAQWRTAQVAADLANGLRDVFLASYARSDRGMVDRVAENLQRHRAADTRSLNEARAALASFVAVNHIVDLEKQSRAMLDQYNNYGVLLEQAETERSTVLQQSKQVAKAVAEARASVEAETKSQRDRDALVDVRGRIEQLKEAIRDDKDHRAGQADLQLREQEMHRAQQLRDVGAVSEADYQRAVTAYEKARIAVVDTAENEKWRADLQRLRNEVIPQAGGASPSAPVLREALTRTLDLQLQQVGVEQRVLSIMRARAELQSKIDRIPAQQGQYDALRATITDREAGLKEIAARLDAYGRTHALQGADFQVVEVAKEPDTPIKSTGKQLTLGVGVGGSLAALLLVVLLELLDTRVRSAAEVRKRLGLIALGTLPRRRARGVFPGEDEQAFAEQCTVVARRVREAAPQRGARLLVVGARAGEGAIECAANLAACLGRQGERVLMVNTRTAPSPFAADAAAHAGGASLADVLEDRAGLASAARPTTHRNVFWLSRGGSAITADHLTSARMAALMEEASREFGLVILDAEPLLESIEAGLVAPHADGVVFVIASHRLRRGELRKAMARLGAAGRPTVGAVLTRASRVDAVQD